MASSEFSEVLYYLNKLIQFYPQRDENLITDIASRKEFQEKDSEGPFLYHQKNIAYILNPRTKINELLIFHKMGTGKTCVAIAVNMFMHSLGNNLVPVKRALVLVKNPKAAYDFK